MRATFEQPDLRPFLRLFERRLAIVDAAVRLARLDADGAAAVLEATSEIPEWLRFNPDALTHRALRALAAMQRGEPGAREQLEEVASLADLRGMRHMIELAHPSLASVLGSPPHRLAAHAKDGGPAKPAAAPGSAGAAATGGLLTPKEARILTLLASGMANKEIARAMDIGEQTVKWHLKNVFFKLNAASRRHAVDRARVLGLLGA